MTQMERYTWLIVTIRQSGEISHFELSKLWESNMKLSGGKPLNRLTFRCWRKNIQAQFGITIDCQRSGCHMYYIKNPDGFDNCSHLMELSRECLRRIKRENMVNDSIIRQDLRDCIFYLQKALSLHEIENDWICYLRTGELLYSISFMSEAEREYIVIWLKEWFKEDSLFAIKCIVDFAYRDLSTSDISKRLLGVRDKKLVRIISKYDEKSYLSLKRHLGKRIVRKHFFMKANEGDANYAYHLADYLYQKKRYEKAFFYLTEVVLSVYDTGYVASYLGLMYFYGRGVARDYEKAKQYLECNTHTLNPEEIYALGEIYMMRMGALGKAAELYLNFLIQPHEDRQNPFYLKIKKRFLGIRTSFGILDWIIMKVKINRSNLKCEFAVEVPACTYVNICWNWDSKRPSPSTHFAGDSGGRLVFSHTYRRPGEYVITIEAPCHKSIEAFEFSKYKKQLKSIDFHLAMGLRKLSIVGQDIDKLQLAPNAYLTGLICRGNNISFLDLRDCPRLMHIDCSQNPITELKLHKELPLTKAYIRGTKIDRYRLTKILRSNRGKFCDSLDYDSLNIEDMRLEYYFRCTNWDKTKKYLRTKLQYYYFHALTECERAFYKLKEMARKNNSTPYKKGFLEVWNDYVSDDTIVGHEEFFFVKEPWSVSLATKVRDMYHKEPWMRCEPTPPEYYVACCLVNMICNDKEMESIMV